MIDLSDAQSTRYSSACTWRMPAGRGASWCSARSGGWSYRDCRAPGLQEVAQRQETRIARMVRRARFPFFKTIDDFNSPTIPRSAGSSWALPLRRISSQKVDA